MLNSFFFIWVAICGKALPLVVKIWPDVAIYMIEDSRLMVYERCSDKKI